MPEIGQSIIVKARIAYNDSDEQPGVVTAVLESDEAGIDRINAKVTPVDEEEVSADSIRLFSTSEAAKAFHVERGGQIVAWPNGVPVPAPNLYSPDDPEDAIVLDGENHETGE